ncbi:MAG: response regulator transcription factor [Chloroflexota bacterium]|nr:response regulator transcription factor [Chloroflexota bacterium]
MSTPPHADVIRILLVDDHTIVRSGLRMLISSEPGLKVVGEADGRASALDSSARLQPDIILLDLDLGGESSLDFLPDLLANVPQARVILLTGTRNPDEHVRAVRLGAMGVVLKEQAAEVLIRAIQKVHAGEAWLDPTLTARLLTGMAPGRGARQVDPEAIKIAALTDREREVIALICEGLQNKTIGQRLFISETTVRHHLTSIFSKLGLENRLELVIYAYRHGLAQPPR